MLKALTLIALLFSSLKAFPCWKLQGSFTVEGNTHQIHQKIEHDKEYHFPLGNLILKMTFHPVDKKVTKMNYVIHEKRGLDLITVTKGEEVGIRENEVRDVLAKSEDDRSISIIRIKLKHI